MNEGFAYSYIWGYSLYYIIFTLYSRLLWLMFLTHKGTKEKVYVTSFLKDSLIKVERGDLNSNGLIPKQPKNQVNGHIVHMVYIISKGIRDRKRFCVDLFS